MSTSRCQAPRFQAASVSTTKQRARRAAVSSYDLQMSEHKTALARKRTDTCCQVAVRLFVAIGSCTTPAFVGWPPRTPPSFHPCTPSAWHLSMLGRRGRRVQRGDGCHHKPCRLRGVCAPLYRPVMNRVGNRVPPVSPLCRLPERHRPSHERKAVLAAGTPAGSEGYALAHGSETLEVGSHHISAAHDTTATDIHHTTAGGSG